VVCPCGAAPLKYSRTCDTLETTCKHEHIRRQVAVESIMQVLFLGISRWRGPKQFSTSCHFWTQDCFRTERAYLTQSSTTAHATSPDHLHQGFVSPTMQPGGGDRKDPAGVWTDSTSLHIRQKTCGARSPTAHRV
jgi:hypothetical protein